MKQVFSKRKREIVLFNFCKREMRLNNKRDHWLASDECVHDLLVPGVKGITH